MAAAILPLTSATLPAARSVVGSLFEIAVQMDNHDMEHLDVIDGDEQLQTQASHPKTTKLCVRHQRMAHEGTNLMLQQVS